VITLRQLQVFTEVAEAGGSITHAATKLGISQPSVSDTVRALESDLDAKLLAGRGKARGLTAEGEIYRDYAQRIRTLVDEGRQAVADLRAEVSGHLRIVAVPTAGEHLVPATLHPFVQQHPAVEVSLRVANRAAAIGWLTDGWADVAVMGRPPSNLPLVAEPFLPNRLVLICAPSHPLAHGAIELAEVAKETILIREQGSGTRLAVESVFASADLELASTMEIGSNAAVIAAVHEGLGIAILPEVAISPDLRTGRLVSVDAPGFPLEREWYVLRLATGYLSGPARAFIDQLTACAIDADGTVSCPPASPATQY
jgi:DNA-binding transcriptional LysR family regulator